MSLELRINKDDIVIIDTEHESTYPIRRKELARESQGYSDWIMQLLEKNWITTEVLYQLAQTIKKEFPHNTINWHETFFVVEKANYLNSMSEILLKKNKSGAKNAFEEIKFGANESNEETHQIIDEIVYKRLDQYGL